MLQFSIFSVNQPQAEVSIVHRAQTLCETFGNSGHSVDLYGENLELVNFMCNTQNGNLNYNNAYNSN